MTKPRKMTVDEFDRHSEALLALSREVMEAKRPEYTLGDVNVLENFDSVAARVGITEPQVALVYALKHVDAITSVLGKGMANSEPMEGRFKDLLSYVFLLFAIYRRGQEEPEQRVFEWSALPALGSSPPDEHLQWNEVDEAWDVVDGPCPQTDDTGGKY